MVSIFLSYSHSDEELKNELKLHLEVLLREGGIDLWDDRRMLPGQEIDLEIDSRLNDAQIILLLVSHHFLASKYCYEIEFIRAKQRHEEKSAHVIPVILSECDWRNTPFSKLVVLPQDGKPVTKYPDRNEAYLQVVNAVRAVSKTLLETRSGERQTVCMKSKSTDIRRSSKNLQVKDSFADYDRHRFLHEAFDYISRFIEESLAELSLNNPEVKTSYRRIENDKFNAAIYLNGEKVSSCQLRIKEDTSFMGKGVGIAYLINDEPKSYNVLLQVEEIDHLLFMKATIGGIAFLGDNTQAKLTVHESAEYCWSRLIEPPHKSAFSV